MGLVKDPEPELRIQIQRLPYVASFHTSLAYDLLFKQRFQECLEESRAALRLDSEEKWAHVYAGEALRHLGQLKSSQAEFREAISVDWIERISENSEQLNRKPPEADYYFYLALALAEQGRVSEARSKLHKAMELSHARMEYIEDLEQKLGGR